VAQGGVEDAALAVFLAPRNRKVAGVAVIGVLVEGQQAAHLVPLEVLHDVDLVEHLEVGPQVHRRGMVQVPVDGVDAHLGLVVRNSPPSIWMNGGYPW